MTFHRRSLLALALALAVAPAYAQPKVSQPRVGQLAEVVFQHGSRGLPSGSEPVLGKVAAWAKANPEGLIVVEGHADYQGSAKLNLALSTQRAESVVEQLLVLGIARDQIVVASFGESRAGRRVLVWSTRAGYPEVEAELRARGAHTVQTSTVMAQLTDRETTVRV